MIESEGYKRECTLDKVLPTGIDNVLVEIDRHWILHIYDESLQTTGLNRYLQDDDSYIDIEIKEGKSLTTD